MKKFLIIPILIFVYIFSIDILSQMSFVAPSTINKTLIGGEAVVGISQIVEVSVRRPYIFGLIYLPVFIEGLGDIGAFNDAFFALIFILVAAFILMEIKHRKEIKGGKAKIKRR
jgi:hypothetical protein